MCWFRFTSTLAIGATPLICTIKLCTHIINTAFEKVQSNHSGFRRYISPYSGIGGIIELPWRLPSHSNSSYKTPEGCWRSQEDSLHWNVRNYLFFDSENNHIGSFSSYWFSSVFMNTFQNILRSCKVSGGHSLEEMLWFLKLEAQRCPVLVSLRKSGNDFVIIKCIFTVLQQ